MERKKGAIKEGYLVKKRHVQHRWKTRWFVLLEDRVDYYRKKDRDTLVGSVSLVKAAVSYPVSGYEKRPVSFTGADPRGGCREGVFVVSTQQGRELLLRAATDDDREVWTHAIGGVIRALEGVIQKESADVVKKLSHKVNLSDVLGAMQDQDAGVTRNHCTVDDVQYDNCFSGTTVVDWLLRWSFANNRQDAVSVATDLLRLAHLQVMKSTMPNVSHKEAVFEDSQSAIYRFTSVTQVHQPTLESSSGSSNSSTGEFSEGDLLDSRKKPSKCRTVKEGILMKRDNEEPLKVVSLELGDRVMDADNGSKELQNVVVKKKQHVFCIQKHNGTILLFQAEDDQARKQWVQALTHIIPKAAN